MDTNMVLKSMSPSGVLGSELSSFYYPDVIRKLVPKFFFKNIKAFLRYAVTYGTFLDICCHVRDIVPYVTSYL